jgi:hypothetical protein
MLVDGLDGAMHQAHGEMPNMALIIGKNGRVVYKSDVDGPRGHRGDDRGAARVEDATSFKVTTMHALPPRLVNAIYTSCSSN